MPEVGDRLRDPTTGTLLRFVATAASTHGEAVVMELGAPREWSAGPRHVHPEQSETIAVVAGTLRAFVGSEQRVVRAGEEVVVPPATPHTVVNASAADVQLRVEFRPALRTDALFEAMFGGGSRPRPPSFLPATLRAWLESRGFGREIRYLWARPRGLVELAATARRRG